jgi:hypothetical protein
MPILTGRNWPSVDRISLDAVRKINDNAREGNANGIRILTNVAFFRGNVKAYEMPLIEATAINASDRKAAIFQLDVPLLELKPGFYTCQVNVIDDAAGHFLFPRVALLVRP